MNLHPPKPGRTTFEIPAREWPVVTKTMLASGLDPDPDANPLVHTAMNGYVWLCNVETSLKRLKTLATNSDDAKLLRRCEVQLERLVQLKEEWPLTVVGS